MLFNSFKFIFLFLPVVLFLSARLKGRWLAAWITVSSYIFYAFAGHVWFLIPMLATTVFDFFVARKMAAAKDGWTKKGYLLASLCGSLGLLFYFKYSLLLSHSFLSLSRLLFDSSGIDPDLFHTILPAGISFYTFQTISYMVDVYKGEARPETSFWRFAAFVSFFPHLVAGPLTRHNQLIPPLKKIEEHGISPRWEAGVFFFVIGLSKKILVADTIARFIDPIILDIPRSGFILSWVALLGFSLQIYFDFSGYTDMAIGLGRLFGIELPKNFDRPYQAVNPSDFWRRWHITLSRWLRDYLYIPLGGNRQGAARMYRNILVTMVLGGLWHGAHWTFAAWGLYHAALLLLYHSTQRFWDARSLWVQRMSTFLCVCLGWVFFRASNVVEAGQWYRNLFGFSSQGLDLSPMRLLQVSTLIAVSLVIVNINSAMNRLKSMTWIEGMALGSLAVLDINFMNSSARFLYFQF